MDKLLFERRIDWFDEAIVPVLEALHGSRPKLMPLNIPAGDAFPDAPRDAIVEVDCEVSHDGVHARVVPPLPAKPAALTRQLIDYERALLELPARPSEAQIADALALHPLAPRDQLDGIARALADIQPERLPLT